MVLMINNVFLWHFFLFCLYGINKNIFLCKSNKIKKAEMNTVDNISYADSLLNILPDGIVILTFDERVLQVNLQARTGLHINIS